jgi:hypothetical protein
MSFNMLSLHLWYKGKVFDMTDKWNVVNAQVYPPVPLMELTNGTKVNISGYDCDDKQARRFASSFTAVWNRLPEVVRVVLDRHWTTECRTLSVLLTEADPAWAKRTMGYASSSYEGTGIFCWAEVLPRVPDRPLATTIAHELGHMAFIALGEPAHKAKGGEAEGLIAELLPVWGWNQEEADEWLIRHMNTYESPVEWRDRPLTNSQYAPKQKDYREKKQNGAAKRQEYKEKQQLYFKIVAGTCSPELAEIVRTDPKRLDKILRGKESEPRLEE